MKSGQSAFLRPVNDLGKTLVKTDKRRKKPQTIHHTQVQIEMRIHVYTDIQTRSVYIPMQGHGQMPHLCTQTRTFYMRMHGYSERKRKQRSASRARFLGEEEALLLKRPAEHSTHIPPTFLLLLLCLRTFPVARAFSLSFLRNSLRRSSCVLVVTTHPLLPSPPPPLKLLLPALSSLVSSLLDLLRLRLRKSTRTRHEHATPLTQTPRWGMCTVSTLEDQSESKTCTCISALCTQMNTAKRVYRGVRACPCMQARREVCGVRHSSLRKVLRDVSRRRGGKRAERSRGRKKDNEKKKTFPVPERTESEEAPTCPAPGKKEETRDERKERGPNG